MMMNDCCCCNDCMYVHVRYSDLFLHCYVMLDVHLILLNLHYRRYYIQEQLIKATNSARVSATVEGKLQAMLRYALDGNVILYAPCGICRMNHSGYIEYINKINIINK
jgi:hypothetical protein